MVGNDRYRTDVYADLSEGRRYSLLSFYLPLIGPDALAVYEYLYYHHPSSFTDLNSLLNILNVSIDRFEEALGKLNSYRLLRTLKKEDEDLYIFTLENPLTPREFTKNDILVRDFILKTDGEYYKSLLEKITVYDSSYKNYKDISKKLDLSALRAWRREDDELLNRKEEAETYRFDTLFDVNTLLRGMSSFLFPLRFRTKENLEEIARLGDLYAVSYDRMRTYISKCVRTGDDSFDLAALRRLCMSSLGEYRKVEDGNYDVPCLTYLMSLQNGKEVTRYDRQIIYKLSNEYHLRAPVINVLLEHSLKNCDNRLLENYIYPVASDLHRNDISTAKAALERLDRYKGRRTNNDVLPSYDSSSNPELDEERLRELLNRRKNRE